MRGKLEFNFVCFRGGENRGDGDAVPLGPSSETSRLRRVDKRLAGRAFPRIRGSLLQKLWTQSEEMDHVQRATRNLVRWIRNREFIFIKLILMIFVFRDTWRLATSSTEPELTIPLTQFCARMQPRTGCTQSATATCNSAKWASRSTATGLSPSTTLSQIETPPTDSCNGEYLQKQDTQLCIYVFHERIYRCTSEYFRE